MSILAIFVTIGNCITFTRGEVRTIYSYMSLLSKIDIIGHSLRHRSGIDGVAGKRTSLNVGGRENTHTFNLFLLYTCRARWNDCYVSLSSAVPVDTCVSPRWHTLAHSLTSDLDSGPPFSLGVHLAYTLGENWESVYISEILTCSPTHTH